MAKIDRTKLANEIRLKIGKDNEVPLRTKAFAKEVAAYWRDVAWPTSTGNHGPGIHPYETGGYRESIDVRRNRNVVTGRYIAGWIVESKHPDANFLEFGTGPDKPGSRSPFGPNTPTPEFAPAARTAHHFRGTAP
jgi:hypothetical protein